MHWAGPTTSSQQLLLCAMHWAGLTALSQQLLLRITQQQ